MALAENLANDLTINGIEQVERSLKIFLSVLGRSHPVLTEYQDTLKKVEIAREVINHLVG
jgi:hypothetical protein